MDQPLFPEAERRCRRAHCLGLLARARHAHLDQREGLLAEAAILAAIHEELTGTPLLPELEARLWEVRHPPREPA